MRGSTPSPYKIYFLETSTPKKIARNFAARWVLFTNDATLFSEFLTLTPPPSRNMNYVCEQPLRKCWQMTSPSREWGGVKQNIQIRNIFDSFWVTRRLGRDILATQRLKAFAVIFTATNFAKQNSKIQMTDLMPFLSNPITMYKYMHHCSITNTTVSFQMYRHSF